MNRTDLAAHYGILERLDAAWYALDAAAKLDQKLTHEVIPNDQLELAKLICEQVASSISARSKRIEILGK